MDVGQLVLNKVQVVPFHTHTQDPVQPTGSVVEVGGPVVGETQGVSAIEQGEPGALGGLHPHEGTPHQLQHP